MPGDCQFPLNNRHTGPRAPGPRPAFLRSQKYQFHHCWLYADLWWSLLYSSDDLRQQLAYRRLFPIYCRWSFIWLPLAYSPGGSQVTSLPFFRDGGAEKQRGGEAGNTQCWEERPVPPRDARQTHYLVQSTCFMGHSCGLSWSTRNPEKQKELGLAELEKMIY